jgi:hypothetical protein
LLLVADNPVVDWNWFDLIKVGVTAVLAFGAGRLSKRLDRRQERKDAEAGLAPAFVLEHESGRRFRLVNIGDADATGVTLDLGDHPKGLTRDVPQGIVLTAGAGQSVMLGETAQSRLPSQLWVRCDQLAAPVPVVARRD